MQNTWKLKGLLLLTFCEVKNWDFQMGLGLEVVHKDGKWRFASLKVGVKIVRPPGHFMEWFLRLLSKIRTIWDRRLEQIVATNRLIEWGKLNKVYLFVPIPCRTEPMRTLKGQKDKMSSITSIEAAQIKWANPIRILQLRLLPHYLISPRIRKIDLLTADSILALSAPRTLIAFMFILAYATYIKSMFGAL